MGEEIKPSSGQKAEFWVMQTAKTTTIGGLATLKSKNEAPGTGKVDAPRGVRRPSVSFHLRGRPQLSVSRHRGDA